MAEEVRSALGHKPRRLAKWRILWSSADFRVLNSTYHSAPCLRGSIPLTSKEGHKMVSCTSARSAWTEHTAWSLLGCLSHTPTCRLSVCSWASVLFIVSPDNQEFRWVTHIPPPCASMTAVQKSRQNTGSITTPCLDNAMLARNTRKGKARVYLQPYTKHGNPKCLSIFDKKIYLSVCTWSLSISRPTAVITLAVNALR